MSNVPVCSNKNMTEQCPRAHFFLKIPGHPSSSQKVSKQQDVCFFLSTQNQTISNNVLELLLSSKYLALFFFFSVYRMRKQCLFSLSA